MTAPIPVATSEPNVEGTVVGDDRTAMEAAIDAGPSAPAGETQAAMAPGGEPALAPNAPDSYVVKRGDTLWGIAKVFLRDPWFWPEIWQVNKQIQNPHLIYPGDTLRLVYIDGRPRVTLQRGVMERGDSARVLPRVRSEPLESAITTIPYAAVAAFMSKPTVLSNEQIKGAPYVFSTRNSHLIISNGDTLYARGFQSPAETGMHYNVIRVGDPLRDPDDDRIVGYDGIFTGSGHVTRGGEPATLIMTESSRETVPGDKLFAGGGDVPLDFTPSPPKVKINGRIMAVSDGVTVIGQYQVVVINRGKRHGIDAGIVLAVDQSGVTVHDVYAKQGAFRYLGGVGTSFAPKVKLPNERVGTLLVFKSFDRVSYGLIIGASNVISVQDVVHNP